LNEAESVTVMRHKLMKRRSSDVPRKEEKLLALRLAADAYARADKLLEDACGDHADPIACTVFVLKKRRLEAVPKKEWLAQVVGLHGDLVTKFGMDSDEVRQVWFPILNGAGTRSKPPASCGLEEELEDINMSQKLQ
jgi:hypothetical protein